MSSWVSGVQQAFTNAVTQATKQVGQITTGLNDALKDIENNLETFGEDVTANLPKIFDAKKALADAAKKKLLIIGLGLAIVVATAYFLTRRKKGGSKK